MKTDKEKVHEVYPNAIATKDVESSSTKMIIIDAVHIFAINTKFLSNYHKNVDDAWKQAAKWIQDEQNELPTIKG